MIESTYRHTYAGDPPEFSQSIEHLTPREQIIANIIYKLALFRHREPTIERLREYSQMDKEEVVEILNGLQAQGIIKEVERIKQPS